MNARRTLVNFGAGALALAAMAILAPAQASLIGDTVDGCVTTAGLHASLPAVCGSGFSGGGNFDPSYPNGSLLELANPVSAVVGGVVEFSHTDSFSGILIHINADFDANSLTLSIDENISDSWTALVWAFRLPDLITNVTLQGGNSIPVSGVTFDDHQIFIDTNGFSIGGGSTLSATFLIASTDVVATPAPGALGLLGFGLAGLVALRRRARR